MDAGSANGTYVGDRKAVTWTTLRDGEEVRFGGARFVFRSGNVFGARALSNLAVHKRISGLRSVMILVVAGLVSGFAVAQYFLYRSYQLRVASSRSASTAQLKEGPRPSASVRTPIKDATAVGLPSTTAPASGPDWLRTLNFWRAMAGVTPVRDEPDAVRGATAHARYMVKNYLARNPETPHHEEPSNPWYSPEGADAAAKGAEYGPGRGSLKPASYEVEGWMDGAFHRLGLIARNLAAASYGHYCESGVCAEVLVEDSPKADTDPLWFGTFPEPVMFPSSGTTLPSKYATLISEEWPEPLSCPGYTRPVGYPITLQFDSRFVPKLASFALSRDRSPTDVCGYDSTSYANSDQGWQAWGRDVLRGNGAVVLIPREPLRAGATYTVTVNVQAQSDPFNFGSRSPFADQMRTYTWSFSLAS